MSVWSCVQPVKFYSLMQKIRSKLFHMCYACTLEICTFHCPRREFNSWKTVCANYATVNAHGICVSLVFVREEWQYPAIVHSMNSADNFEHRETEIERDRDRVNFSIPIDRVSTNWSMPNERCRGIRAHQNEIRLYDEKLASLKTSYEMGAMPVAHCQSPTDNGRTICSYRSIQTANVANERKTLKHTETSSPMNYTRKSNDYEKYLFE